MLRKDVGCRDRGANHISHSMTPLRCLARQVKNVPLGLDSPLSNPVWNARPSGKVVVPTTTQSQRWVVTPGMPFRTITIEEYVLHVI